MTLSKERKITLDFPVSIRTEKLTNTPVQAKVYYPVVYGLDNQEAELKINQAIVNLLNKMLIEENYYEPSLVELIANFEIKNNQRGILSLNLIVYSFTGGAHGMTVVKSLTFDVKTGHSFTLKELFKPGSNYTKEISTIIKEDIKKWNVDIINPFTEISPDQDFYIADTSIVIYFQLYDITPYYWGFPYFPIAILNLKDLIKKDGPLDTMMAFT